MLALCWSDAVLQTESVRSMTPHGKIGSTAPALHMLGVSILDMSQLTKYRSRKDSSLHTVSRRRNLSFLTVDTTWRSRKENDVNEQLFDIMRITSPKQQRERTLSSRGASTSPLPKRLSEVEALALWTVLDHPSPLGEDQELVIVLRIEKDRFSGWVVQMRGSAKPL